MKSGTVIQTFLTRFLIIGLNFGLVIFTTNFWGSEGRGTISLLIADLALIGFFTGIFSGSSVSYFSSRFPKEKVLVIGYLWSVVIGLLLPVLLITVSGHNSDYLLDLMALSVVSSLLSANISLFVGGKNIRMFNLYTILQQVVHFGFLAVLVFGFRYITVSAYFVAQIIAYAILFAISTFQLTKNMKWSQITDRQNVGKSMFQYGFYSQMSGFIQFLNYRLSYYFLEFFKGIGSVGIFSVGVAVSEAVWTLSRSLSLILYSEAVNTDDSNFLIKKTKSALKISFLLTFAFIFLIFLVPAQWYTFIFGEEFSQTKQIIFILSPGILAIATSNIIGHYFAGINRLRILNIKSIVGLLFTVVLSIILIPKYGIEGACIATSVSYLFSSAVLFFQFYRETPFRISDFFLSGEEIALIKNKFRKN